MASKTDNEFEDAPFGVFKLSYSLITWLSTIVLIVVTVWTIWTMFLNTPAGTLRTQRLAAASPTNQAAAQSYMDERSNSCRPPKPDGLATCLACHVIQGSGGQVGPNLNEIRNVALERLADSAYSGSAKSAEDYIRESILEPSSYVVESPAGKAYGSPGASVMPANGGLPEDTDWETYIDYLMFDPEAECEEEVASR